MLKNIFNKEQSLTPEQQKVKYFITNCRNNSKMIKEVVQNKELYPNISSFNFTRNAFYEKEWDELTTKARGIFIDTKNYKVVARSFDKFFTLNERPETNIKKLGDTWLNHPIEVQVKENGFLGIISTINNSHHQFYDVIFAQKSRLSDRDDKTNTCKYANLFADYFFKLYKSIDRNNLYDYLNKNNLSAVFEVILPYEDPHIIEYGNPKIVLLALIKNQLNFEEFEIYPDNCTIERVNKICTFNGFNNINLSTIDKNIGFSYGNDNIFLFKNNIEGFVLKDTITGQRVKVKSLYYLFFKELRNSINKLQKNLYNYVVNKEPFTFEKIIMDCKNINYNPLKTIVIPEVIKGAFSNFTNKTEFDFLNLWKYIYNVQLYFTFKIAHYTYEDDFLNEIYTFNNHKNDFNDIITLRNNLSTWTNEYMKSLELKNMKNKFQDEQLFEDPKLIIKRPEEVRKNEIKKLIKSEY